MCYQQAGGQKYSPSQIGAFVLTKMKETAGAGPGVLITSGVTSGCVLVVQCQCFNDTSDCRHLQCHLCHAVGLLRLALASIGGFSALQAADDACSVCLSLSQSGHP
jgi:hypothetical protein